VVRERLATYKAQTEPVMAYYRQQGVVKIIEVDGMQSPDEVGASMVEALKTIE